MKARDVMTRDVVTVTGATSVHEVARLMTERHISGVPVVSADGALLGIISQSDLLHRAELGTERKKKAWLRFFQDRDSMAAEFAKSHGLKVQDVMTRTLVSVHEDAELQDVATTLASSNIKRVPVVRDGKLVGIVSRGDLVRALSAQPSAAAAGRLSDAELRQALLEKMRKQPWLNSSYLNVIVANGTVELWGMIESDQQRKALRVLVDEQPGVQGVDDKLKVGVVVHREF